MFFTNRDGLRRDSHNFIRRDGLGTASGETDEQYCEE